MYSVLVTFSLCRYRQLSMTHNINFIALHCLTYKVSYQLKILTTALFSVMLLGKQLSRVQWVSLLVLFGGVSLVQVAQIDSSKVTSQYHNQVSRARV